MGRTKLNELIYYNFWGSHFLLARNIGGGHALLFNQTLPLNSEKNTNPPATHCYFRPLIQGKMESFAALAQGVGISTYTRPAKRCHEWHGPTLWVIDFYIKSRLKPFYGQIQTQMDKN